MKIKHLKEKNVDIRKAGAYARVSTLQEEQEESFNSQVVYFREMITVAPDLELVDIYADHGKSGTSLSKRPEFQRMIQDAKDGKLDVIYVKSVSRFGRNSKEVLRYVMMLKSWDVEVIFEKENLSTFDPRADMVFNFSAAIAEETSKSISKNTKWAYEKLAEEGIRHLGNNRILGFDEVDGELTPNEQAWIPKMIFEKYAEGASVAEIIETLDEMGAKRLKSDGKFQNATILCILRNECYVGDRQIQKQPHTDYKTKRPVAGTPYNTYFVEEDHEPIVDRATWDKAQERLKKEEVQRQSGVHGKRHSHFLYGRLFCGECGEPMTRKSIRNQKKVWVCRDRKLGSKGNGCKNSVIAEEELLTKLALRLGVAKDVEDLTEDDFENLKSAKFYDDGRIELE